MEDDLVENVKRALARTEDEFDQLYPGEIDLFTKALAGGYSELRLALPRFGKEPVASRRQGARDQYSMGWFLLWDACNGLLGAFSLLLRGYETETLALSRLALERVACALVLVDNPGSVSAFAAGTADRFATRAIGATRLVNPDLSRTWGVLSNFASHVSPGNVGTSVSSSTGEELEMVIGGRLSADASRGFRKGASLLTDFAELLAAAPEHIFFSERRRKATLQPKKKSTTKKRRRTASQSARKKTGRGKG